MLDVVVAGIALVLALPLMLGAATAVRLRLGAPVLFRQIRPGYRGRPFTVLKFRTMRDSRGPDGQLLPDSARLTRLGRLLRSTSLDELPQLWNVLKGEMSLVGPRPLLLEYLPLYTPEQARRHDVKPGMTSWSAVNGRNTVDWEQQLQMDVWYVDHRSLALDLKILLLTAFKVVQREGVTQQGHATRDRFCGTRAPAPASAAPPAAAAAPHARETAGAL